MLQGYVVVLLDKSIVTYKTIIYTYTSRWCGNTDNFTQCTRYSYAIYIYTHYIWIDISFPTRKHQWNACPWCVSIEVPSGWEFKFDETSTTATWQQICVPPANPDPNIYIYIYIYIVKRVANSKYAMSVPPAPEWWALPKVPHSSTSFLSEQARKIHDSSSESGKPHHK